MYKSPIDMLVTDIQHQISSQEDEQIYQAVVSVGINVDKEELIRALKYDRDQYAKGHLDGVADAMAELVRCKDCIYYHKELGYSFGQCSKCNLMPYPDDFCSYGERREGE